VEEARSGQHASGKSFVACIGQDAGVLFRARPNASSARHSVKVIAGLFQPSFDLLGFEGDWRQMESINRFEIARKLVKLAATFR
jgi:hypothetical protein